MNKKHRLENLLCKNGGEGGFEPPVEFKARQSLSRRSRSATPAPPRVCGCSRRKVTGGRGGIRTHVGFHQTCFQDRRLKPLGHPSLFLRRDCHFITSDTRGQAKPGCESTLSTRRGDKKVHRSAIIQAERFCRQPKQTQRNHQVTSRA